MKEPRKEVSFRMSAGLLQDLQETLRIPECQEMLKEYRSNAGQNELLRQSVELGWPLLKQRILSN